MLGALGRNLPIKITSLVLATLLWAMVAGQREVIRTLRVALDLPALPDSLMYLQSPPASVQVTFRASGRKLFWLRLRPPLLRPGLSLQATDEPVVLRLREELLELRDAGAAFVQFDEPVLTEVALGEAQNRRTFM